MEKWVLYAILSMLFAGCTSVLAKFGLKEMDANSALVIRTAIVMGFVIVNYFLFKENTSTALITSKHITFLVLSGITTGFSWVFYYKALKIGKVTYVSTIDKGSVVVAILLSYLFLKEPLTPKLVVGGGLVLAGLLVMVLWE
ncbi:MAG: EamA family transporter [Bacteroidota bacterium]